jgi:hypothetical protein
MGGNEPGYPFAPFPKELPGSCIHRRCDLPAFGRGERGLLLGGYPVASVRFGETIGRPVSGSENGQMWCHGSMERWRISCQGTTRHAREKRPQPIASIRDRAALMGRRR